MQNFALKIKSTFKDIQDINNLKQIGEGFGSTVLQAEVTHNSFSEKTLGVNHNTYIFRISKNFYTQARHKREIQILKHLPKYIGSVQIPQPEFYSESNQYFNFGLMGYKKLEGITFEPQYLNQQNTQQFAKNIAEFLYGLHTTKLPADLKVKKENDFPITLVEFTKIFETTKDYLHTHLNAQQYQNFISWNTVAQEFLQNLNYISMVIHGDFWYENLLIDSQQDLKITAALDFETCGLGYNMLDFIVLDYISKDFRNLVIEEYKKLGGQLDVYPALKRQASYKTLGLSKDLHGDIDYTVQMLMGIRELFGLAYCIETEHMDEDSVGKVVKECNL